MIKKLRPIFKDDKNAILADAKRNFTSPDIEIQKRKKVSPSELIGNMELTYHRAEYVGIFSAYLTIKEKYPKVAKELLEAFSMKDKNGEWVVG